MSLRPGIQRRIESLDKKTKDLFLEMESLSPALLTRKPEPGYWSALEALNHIYLGEKLSLEYVRYKLTRPDTIPARRPDAWLRTLMLKWILYSPLKVKSPPQINMRNEQPLLSLFELHKAWADLRTDLSRILEEHEIPLRNSLTYKQPYAGRMTLNQMLIFFEDHLVHHTRQIRQIIRRISA